MMTDYKTRTRRGGLIKTHRFVTRGCFSCTNGSHGDERVFGVTVNNANINQGPRHPPILLHTLTKDSVLVFFSKRTRTTLSESKRHEQSGMQPINNGSGQVREYSLPRAGLPAFMPSAREGALQLLAS